MSDIMITKIHRCPVKSMLGETPKEVMLSERGIQGDRAWATRDEVRGGIRGAKKLPQLMLFGARSVDGNTSEITAPDGSTCLTSSDEMNHWLSEKLDHSVTLCRYFPPITWSTIGEARLTQRISNKNCERSSGAPPTNHSLISAPLRKSSNSSRHLGPILMRFRSCS